MRRLLPGYAVSFNRRHQRSGQLFQNRYKSIVCQEDVYLRELVRYIHLNPVRAGMVESIKALNRYLYCGHGAVMGKTKRPWQDVDYVLGCFGKTARRARREYMLFLGCHRVGHVPSRTGETGSNWKMRMKAIGMIS